MRVAYADPPYLGVCARYGHPDQDGCWDDLATHRGLVERLGEYDAWALSASAQSLQAILTVCPDDVRVMAWCKPWCSWKPGAHPKYAWEPVIIRGARKPRRSQMTDPTDYVVTPASSLKFLGAKPEPFVWWVLSCLGVRTEDEFVDLFPGSGAVGRAWEKWRAQMPLPLAALEE